MLFLASGSPARQLDQKNRLSLPFKPPTIMKFPLDAVSKNRSVCLDKEDEKEICQSSKLFAMRTFARLKLSAD